MKNARALSSTPLRRDALAILEAGLKTVETSAAVRRAVRRDGDRLKIGSRAYRLSRFKNVYLVAIGKAAFDASMELEKILGKRLIDGLALDVKGGALARVASRVGTHPYPSLQNMKATGEIMALLKHAEADDLVIAVVSGGGSAMLCWPTQLTCKELSSLTEMLMRKGAAIQEMNTVRKHTSDIQGGQLAQLAYPARVAGLIFSDVPGDDLSTVASGPTFLDPTTKADAARVLAKYDLLKACRLPRCELKETPKEAKLFDHVANTQVVSGAQAVEAMKEEARRLGYRPRVFSAAVTGEAREVGERFARSVKPGEALIAAGETTVTISGKGGEGGRNQALALSALPLVHDDALVLSCATDGIDHTPAAGAIADLVTREAAKRKGLDPERSLSRHDEFPFFSAAGAHILTGVTGMNVSDVMLGLRRK